MTNPFAVSREIAEAICYNSINSLVLSQIMNILSDSTITDKATIIITLVKAKNDNAKIIKKILIDNGY